jgi:hypothetical protein
METYEDFDKLARAALRAQNVLVSTYYGKHETTREPLTPRYYVKANGQGLPPDGLQVGRPTPAEAVDAIVRMVKGHKRAQQEERLARDRAKRLQTYTLEELEQSLKAH